LEILWQFGDKTIVEQDGERQEFIGKNNKEMFVFMLIMIIHDQSLRTYFVD